MKEKKVIGWCEYVDLPDWGIKKLKAKIDTGAKSCSLHVEDIKELEGDKICFYVILGKNGHRKKIMAFPDKKGKVKSSTGVQTHRWYVQTRLRIGGVERMVKMNLVGREEMNFRMLIGRTAIQNDFLVDVAHQYLLKKKLFKKSQKKIMKQNLKKERS
ncbi:MAG: RimK/LysX family protein [Candidatus Brocadiaceae bacterium]|nr:RimK/LysX family protein [Candidatus Brocadiaceae bacterium]